MTLCYADGSWEGKKRLVEALHDNYENDELK